jgi:hypothetical protein
MPRTASSTYCRCFATSSPSTSPRTPAATPTRWSSRPAPAASSRPRTSADGCSHQRSSERTPNSSGASSNRCPPG